MLGALPRTRDGRSRSKPARFCARRVDAEVGEADQPGDRLDVILALAAEVLVGDCLRVVRDIESRSASAVAYTTAGWCAAGIAASSLAPTGSSSSAGTPARSAHASCARVHCRHPLARLTATITRSRSAGRPASWRRSRAALGRGGGARRRRARAFAGCACGRPSVSPAHHGGCWMRSRWRCRSRVQDASSQSCPPRLAKPGTRGVLIALAGEQVGAGAPTADRPARPDRSIEHNR
jgi:hypothetical protein